MIARRILCLSLRQIVDAVIHRPLAAPGRDDLAIPASNRTRPPVEIVEPDGMQIVALDTECVLPVDLVRERVPREPRYRNAIRAEMQNVAPLFVEPRDGMSMTAIRFTMEKRNAVALIVLRRQRAKADATTSNTPAPAGTDPMLTRRVIVCSKPSLANRATLTEKAEI